VDVLGFEMPRRCPQPIREIGSGRQGAEKIELSLR
jgi:hypothetical protein